ncbi:MAG: hypothetical protein ACLTDX_07175 [[Clostridium] innocuum]
MTDKKKLWGIAGIVAAVAIVAVAAYFLFSGGSKPESVLLSYTDLLKGRQIQGNVFPDQQRREKEMEGRRFYYAKQKYL